jgi:hypothetical protein
MAAAAAASEAAVSVAAVSVVQAVWAEVVAAVAAKDDAAVAADNSNNLPRSQETCLRTLAILRYLRFRALLIAMD